MNLKISKTPFLTYNKQVIFPIIIPCLIFSLVLSCVGNLSYADTGTTNNTSNTSLVNTYNYSILSPITKNFVDRLYLLPKDFTFTKTLKRKQVVSPDVVYLKWILNSHQMTALTDNPNMTLLQLNASFGPITETAVKKFQTLYRADILDPQGIKDATGIIGPATRSKLNWLLNLSRNYGANANNSLLNNNTANYNLNYNDNNYLYFPYTNNSGQINNYNSTTYNGNFVVTNTETYITSDSSTSTSTAKTTASSSVATSTTGGTSSSANNDNDSSGGAGVIALIGAAALIGGSSAESTAVNTVISQFGGKITMNMLCPCSGNYLITLNDLSTKMSLSLIFQPGASMLKMNYNPTIGETVLGGYIKGPAKCMVYVGTGCTTYGNPTGVIDTRGIGTTLTPASK